MEDKIFELIKWLEGWRKSHDIYDDEVLSGEKLELFISELQTKIVEEIINFGVNIEGYENAILILYSGVYYEDIKSFCEASNGKYYMISQTNANFLWKDEFRDTVAYVIGEPNSKGEITARVLEGKKYSEYDSSWTRISNYATESGNYLALDDFVSSKVVEAGLSKGKILYFIGDKATPNNVGLLTEIPSVYNNAIMNGESLSDKINIATDFVKNADGTFSYNILENVNTNVLIDANGKVKYVDLLKFVNNEGTANIDGTFKINVNDYISAVDKSTVYLDEAGNIIGQSYKGTALDGIVKDTVPSEYTYSTKYDIYSKLADDASMRERWGTEYDTLSVSEKYQAKELDYLARVAVGMAEPEEIAAATLNYCKGAGKTLEELNAIDKAIINFCSDKTIDASRANKLLASLESSGKLSKLAKGAEVAGVAVVTVVSAVT